MCYWWADPNAGVSEIAASHFKRRGACQGDQKSETKETAAKNRQQQKFQQLGRCKKSSQEEDFQRLSQQPEVGSIQWEIREDERGSIIQEKGEEKSRFERPYMWQKQSWSQQPDRPGRIRSMNWGQLIMTSACYNNFRLD